MIHALHERDDGDQHDTFVVFAHETRHPGVVALNGHGWAVQPLESFALKRLAKNALRRVVGEVDLLETWRSLRYLLEGRAGLPDPDAVRSRPDMTRWFRRFGIEMMLYPAPSTLSFETGIPYVMAVHDLQHRLQPEFPEVSANGEGEWREYLFRNAARHATFLLADSEVGKEDILSCYGSYGVTSDRVRILPFLPACHPAAEVAGTERQRVRSSHRVPEQYLFYPAQFWPHKNHARIVQALELLKRGYRLEIPMIFCGSATGKIARRTFREIIELSHRLGVENQICHLGYVSDEDMRGLYAGAVALVIPTFFGPTNIPVLEAWAFGCPVMTSDIRGIRQQAGEAALLVDPRSVEAIAEGVHRLWTDEDLRRALADRGRQRLTAYTADDYRERLSMILDEAGSRVRAHPRTSTKR
jgi:glycosyltransferase involved in cell wall biosynthesis